MYHHIGLELLATISESRFTLDTVHPQVVGEIGCRPGARLCAQHQPQQVWSGDTAATGFQHSRAPPTTCGCTTLDELVIKVRELFSEQGMAQVVGLILHLVDELLASRHTTSQATPPRACSCGHTRYELKDRSARQLHTSVGTVEFRWRRLTCRHCQKTWCPLREFLGLELWQSKTAELERIAVEVVSEQSYRRGSRHLAVAGEIPVAKSTLHRWVVESQAADWTPLS